MSTPNDTPTLLSESHIIILLIGAKAALVYPPPHLGREAVTEPNHWWKQHNSSVLRYFCSEFRLPVDTLPDPPTWEDVRTVAETLPQNVEFRLQVALLFLRLSLTTLEIDGETGSAEGGNGPSLRLAYSAATRGYLFHILLTLNIPAQALHEAERVLADELFNQVSPVTRSPCV
jgi:hypothetical protein